MINLTTDIILVTPDLPSLRAAVERTARECMPKNTIGDSIDKQARHRYALQLLLEKNNIQMLNESHIYDMFQFTNMDKCSSKKRSQIYKNLAKTQPIFDVDIIGLQTPFRAIFLQLWRAGEILLPYEFTIAGVSKKYPNIYKQTSFTTDLAMGAKEHVYESINTFKYMTNWHTAQDLCFDELWSVAPEICEIQSRLKADTTLRTRFSYLAWLEIFSTEYPEIISRAQVAYLKKYHEHLHASASENFGEISKTYEEFVDYWKVDPLEYDKLSAKEKSALRYRSRINPNAVKRDQKHTKIQSEQFLSEVRQSAADFEGFTAYDAYLFITKSNRKHGRSEPNIWIKNNYYHGCSGLTTEITGRFWREAAQAFADDLKAKGYGKSHRKSVQGNINILLDYVFLYLVLWFRENRVPGYEPPLYVSDFARGRFWSSIKDTKSVFFTPIEELDRPLTLLSLYQKTRTQKAASKFCRDIFDFFEFCRAHRQELLVDDTSVAPEDFDNPIFLKIDAPGSGGRTETDKLPLPIDSVVVARGYITALDEIGCQIRERILSGAISKEMAQEISKKSWINLNLLDIEKAIKIRDDEEEKLIIKLDDVINAYQWKKYEYKNFDGTKIHTIIPWMSSLRMLQVGLFAGQRIQSAQWLDVHTFASYEPYPLNPLKKWVSLLINTDKSGQEHIATVPSSVFEALLDERNFQLNTYGVPYTSVFYENDEGNETYDKIFPLFRSPWNPKGLPFSDGAYSAVWIKVLQGIENEFNKIVPEERKHAFVYQNPRGEISAHHTPHSLRSTWITHMSIYGELEFGPIGKQVMHKDAKTSAYYMRLDRDQLVNAVTIGNQKMLQVSSQNLLGSVIQTSNTSSALQKGWQDDRSKCVGEQHTISKFSSLVESKITGQDLVDESANSRVAFLTVCICMLNGKCPKELLAFTYSPQCCGLCPYAVFGVDHLGALHAKVRRLTDEIDASRDRLKHIPNSISSNERDEARRRLTLLCIEHSGYVQAIDILQQRLVMENRKNDYICRHREIDQAVKIDIDLDDPVQRIFAQILDWKLYPAFASEHYPATLYKLARTPELKKLIPETMEESEIYASQIISMFRSGITNFGTVARLMKNQALELAHEPL